MALAKEMVQEMARRQVASQSLRLTFCNNREGIDALRVVYCNNTVTFYDGSIFAQAVIESEEWADHRGDRSFTVSSCQLLSDDCFLNHVESGVESISSGGDSPLKALQSGRQKKRQEALDAIIEKCVTDEFREFVAEWGLQLNIELQETYGLYGIEICVVGTDDTPYLRVFLDAWNGAVSLGDSENESVCFHFSIETGSKNVQELLEKELERSLETLTA